MRAWVVSMGAVLAGCNGVIDPAGGGPDRLPDGGLIDDSCGSNDRQLVLGQLAQPTLSHDRGFYDQAFTLAVSAVEPGAEIIYTLDGSEPNASNGQRAASPVSMEVGSTTVLRARAVRADATDSHVTTATFLFVDQVMRQAHDQAGAPNLVFSAFPSGQMTLDHEMDPSIVDADPAAMRASLLSIPSLSLVMAHDDLFGANGIYAAGGSGLNTAFQRATSVELLDPVGPRQQFQIDAAIRPHTHVLVKRSFKLLFKREYGPGKLDSCLLQNAPQHGATATTRFDTLILRGGTNRSLSQWCNPDDSVLVEDQWMHDSQLATGSVGSHGTWVHLYINGLYYGVYNAMERPDDSFAASYLGGANEDWFSINHGGYVDGDPSRWEYLVGSLINRDMSDDANYQELTQYLDVDSFIDYLLVNWYGGTTDWPENNWYGAMRTNPPGPMRFFIWDADEVWDGRCAGPGDPVPDHFGAWVMPSFRSNVGSTGLAIADIWHAARRNPTFMQRFADRVTLHLTGSGALTEAQSLARWNALVDYIRLPMLAETARWGDSRAELGERKRTIENMWAPTEQRWRSERLPGNVPRFLDALRAEGYVP